MASEHIIIIAKQRATELKVPDTVGDIHEWSVRDYNRPQARLENHEQCVRSSVYRVFACCERRSEARAVFVHRNRTIETEINGTCFAARATARIVRAIVKPWKPATNGSRNGRAYKIINTRDFLLRHTSAICEELTQQSPPSSLLFNGVLCMFSIAVKTAVDIWVVLAHNVRRPLVDRAVMQRC